MSYFRYFWTTNSSISYYLFTYNLHGTKYIDRLVKTEDMLFRQALRNRYHYYLLPKQSATLSDRISLTLKSNMNKRLIYLNLHVLINTFTCKNHNNKNKNQ